MIRLSNSKKRRVSEVQMAMDFSPSNEIELGTQKPRVSLAKPNIYCIPFRQNMMHGNFHNSWLF